MDKYHSVVDSFKQNMDQLQNENKHLLKQNRSLREQHEIEITEMKKKLKVVDGPVVI